MFHCNPLLAFPVVFLIMVSHGTECKTVISYTCCTHP
jgi:hypothetical protein